MLILPAGFQKKREVSEMPPARMARIIDFAALAGIYGMGLHCSKCGQDFVASNDEHAPVYSMKCGCREFWSQNPNAGKGTAH